MVNTNEAAVKTPLAGVFSIAVGVINILMALYIIAIPAQRAGTDSNTDLLYQVLWTAISITGILGFAAVLPAVNQRLKNFQGEWLQIASILALVGWAAMALKYLTLLGGQTGELDPLDLLTMACPGVWLVTANAMAFRKRVWSKVIAVFGVICGIAYISVTPASIFDIELLNLAAAGVGGIAAPVWFIGMGVRFLQE
jgi:hypothetical protein